MEKRQVNAEALYVIKRGFVGGGTKAKRGKKRWGIASVQNESLGGEEKWGGRKWRQARGNN